MATTTPSSISSPSVEQLRWMQRTMWRIRAFDTKALEVYRAGLMRGTSHPYIGMEAVGVGICAALRRDDFITSTHRGHGHCISKGGDINGMFAELLGKATGTCKGKGGSMHIAEVDRGILGANGIVGGGMGIAAGSALSAKLRGTDQVTVCFFGDGALNQGVLHEVSNMAAIWKLPLVLVCENNGFAMSARVENTVSQLDAAARAAAYGFPGLEVDGMDILAVYEAATHAVARARAAEGPSLLMCRTYRYFGHHAGDPLNYRAKEEVDPWRAKDPIERLEKALIGRGIMTEEQARQVEEEEKQGVERALEFAQQSPDPALDTLMEDIYA
jgi:TPP-dependent pyruvate/acetoin dehydrogenase alpha subunit